MSGLRLRVSTADPERARDEIASVYCPHRVDVLGEPDAFRARFLQGGFDGLGVHYLDYGQADTQVEPIPFDSFVLVSRPVSGRFAVRGGDGNRTLRAGQSVLLDADTTYRMRWYDGCRLLTMMFSRSDVDDVLGELGGHDRPVRARFPVTSPLSAAASARWDAVTRFLLHDVLPTGMAQHSPLVRRQVIRLALVSLLESYPGTQWTMQPVSAGSVLPSAIRRAVGYIEQRAGDDIGIRDIAAAARLGPRALQEGFRRHLDTTPLGYLRAVRLRGAHEQLRDASPDSGVTVTDVAIRWGFGNLGRFAAAHRAMFGRSPGEVLRS